MSRRWSRQSTDFADTVDALKLGTLRFDFPNMPVVSDFSRRFSIRAQRPSTNMLLAAKVVRQRPQLRLKLRMPSDATKLPTPVDPIAVGLRGFGPLGIIAIVVIVASQFLAPLNAVLVLIWAKRSHTPWREIGYVRPRSWFGGLIIGVTLGIAFKFLMKAVVMPLLGAESVNQTYHYLVGNRTALIVLVPLMIFTAGFGEETFFRGYLFERFGKLFGYSPGAKALTVLFTTVVFASLHYFDQGLEGAQQATITGLVFGTIFAFTGRLWTLMCAHAAFDLTAVAIIYRGLESDVAHVLFK